VKHTLRIYWRLLGVLLRSQMQYRTSFLLDVMGTGMIVLLEFGSLALVLQKFNNIQGWTLYEVAFLYGTVDTGFGLMDMVFSGFDPSFFGRHVRQGTFDQLLLRPINITVQVLGLDFTLRRLGKIVMGIVIWLTAVANLHIAWTWPKLLLVPTMILAMTAFFGGLFIIGATITFWTVASFEIMNTLTYGGSYVISHPMHIYQTWLRRFFTFIVPLIFLNYFPTLYILDKPDPFNFPAWTPLLSPIVGVLMLLAALAFWRFGIQHYQSTGS
jgi:ABC-2 type transport system permease protein